VNAKSDLQLIEELIARLPIESLESLARRHCTASALARRRLAERDLVIRTLAAGRPGTGHEMARLVHKDLRRYAAGGFRFERDRPPVDNPRRANMHRVLVLNRGKILSERALRHVLAGLSGPNSPAAMAKPAEYLSAHQEPRGRDEGCTAVEGLHRAAGR